ncbi:MAG TPA: thioredoxin fold domain-containing protein [Thermoanaerobaculia bacterium]|nr:thioredoxin fold domain-containing protein [Thermoanaerobaculia bacterium]
MTDPIVCPRCGLEQSQAAECINCGVVFAKVGREPSARPVGAATVASKPRSSLIGGLLLAALAIAAALLFLPRSPSPPPLAATAPPEVDEPAPARGDAPPSEAPAAVEAAVVDEPAPEPLPKERRPARFPTVWYEGATGYRKALQEAREDGTPVAVYFYTDWCGYCRQLDEGLLSTPRVQEPFRYLVKVKINPEKGQAERALADEYRVSGYPSFFILDSADGEARKVGGQVREGEGWRLRTPEEFVEVCYKAARI